MIWILPALLAAACFWLNYVSNVIGQVTKGDRIPNRDGKALLLVDLQSCFWEEKLYDADTRARVEAAVGQAVAEAKAAGHPVIALRQEWSIPSTRVLARMFMGGKALAGGTGLELAAPFAGMADREVVKPIQDGFKTGELTHVLDEMGVGHLTIAGLDGIYCVNKTAQAALGRGFGVTLLADGIASAEPKKLEEVYTDLQTKGAKVA